MQPGTLRLRHDGYDAALPNLSRGDPGSPAPSLHGDDRRLRDLRGAVRDSGCDAARTGLTLENKGISVLRPSMDGLTLVVALSLSF
jgi:hypothetical protein